MGYSIAIQMKVAGDTEQSIFDALGWNYKQPKERKNPSWITNKLKQNETK